MNMRPLFFLYSQAIARLSSSECGESSGSGGFFLSTLYMYGSMSGFGQKERYLNAVPQKAPSVHVIKVQPVQQHLTFFFSPLHKSLCFTIAFKATTEMAQCEIFHCRTSASKQFPLKFQLEQFNSQVKKASFCSSEGGGRNKLLRSKEKP